MYASYMSTTRSINISQGALSHWDSVLHCQPFEVLLWIWCALAAAGSNPHPADAKQQHPSARAAIG